MMVTKIGDMELYNAKDLSEILGINERTVRELVRTGKLKGKKLAKKWYVTEKSLKAYFEERDTPGDELEEPVKRRRRGSPETKEDHN